MPKKAFMIACKEYFGLQPGQTLMQFRDEIKALTDQDRAELAPALGKALDCEVEAGAAPQSA